MHAHTFLLVLIKLISGAVVEEFVEENMRVRVRFPVSFLAWKRQWGWVCQ